MGENFYNQDPRKMRSASDEKPRRGLDQEDEDEDDDDEEEEEHYTEDEHHNQKMQEDDEEAFRQQQRPFAEHQFNEHHGNQRKGKTPEKEENNVPEMPQFNQQQQ